MGKFTSRNGYSLPSYTNTPRSKSTRCCYYHSNSADAFDKLKDMFGGKRRAGRTHFTYTKNESYNPTYEQDAECKTNEKVVSQEEIDRILDKIRKSGYDSLTQSEKQMLFDQSNK